MKKPNYRKKAIELAKKIVRDKSEYCERCGKNKKVCCLHGSHIFPVRYGNTAADPENIIALCYSCHVGSKDSWHESPLEQDWFHEKFPGRFEKLKKKAYSTNKPNWKKIYENLKTICS